MHAPDDDNMDIDNLVDNPYQYLDDSKKKSRPRTDFSGERTPQQPHRSPTAEEPSDETMEHNQPSRSRLLNLEKNLLNTDSRVDALKQAIEEQNERIRLLEEELDILREHLKEPGGEQS